MSILGASFNWMVPITVLEATNTSCGNIDRADVRKNFFQQQSGQEVEQAA